jgi:transcriptional regulator with XRE-family HTH domain
MRSKSNSITRGRPKGVKNGVPKRINPLADLLAEQRLNKGLGMKDISDVLGVTVQYISNVENGHCRLDWKYVQELSELLQVDVFTIAKANLRSSKAFGEYMKVLNGKEFS